VKPDVQNVTGAKRFLLNSLSEELHDIIKLKMSPDDSFIVVWMYQVGVITSSSIKKWDTLKIKLKALVPLKYASEDVFLLAKDYLTYGKTLHAAGQFDLNLQLIMVDGFLLVGGMSKLMESVYCNPLRNLCAKLDYILCEVTFMEKLAVAHHLASKNITFQELCKDIWKWPPTQHAQDSSKSVAAAPSPLLQTMLLFQVLPNHSFWP
jgi:hypothetical protein